MIDPIMTVKNTKLQFQGEKSPSIAPKATMTSWYLICVAAAAWLTFFGTNEGDRSGSPGRQVVLLAFGLIYIVRAASTLFVFMKRKIPWWEAASGGGPIGFMLFLFLRDGLRTPQPLAFVDAIGALLYFVGSYIGTASEYSRHLWKTHPENHGHLCTEGLFRYCRHINYFGDLLLFSGFAVLTRQLWTGIVPLVMGLNFVLFLIPAHDAYLAMRYGSEFEDYERRTKKLLPLVY
jgi:protein-S-isoprenylcysteine O-methyltransferase Ste14